MLGLLISPCQDVTRGLCLSDTTSILFCGLCYGSRVMSWFHCVRALYPKNCCITCAEFKLKEMDATSDVESILAF